MPAPAPAQDNPPYPRTGTNLTKNSTGVSLSTFIIIKVNDDPVGAVQELSVTEDRDIAMIVEVGTDGNVDSAPRNATKYSGSCKRVRLDRLRVAEAFGRGFLHAKSQRVPFEIQIIDTMDGESVDKAVVTIIRNVWFKSINYTYSASDYIISDSMSWVAEDIFTTINAKPAAQNGMRQLKSVYWDPYEVAADMGYRRGAMDSPGLLAIAMNDINPTT